METEILTDEEIIERAQEAIKQLPVADHNYEIPVNDGSGFFRLVTFKPVRYGEDNRRWREWEFHSIR